MAIQSTLSKRGHELAQGPNLREKFKTILADRYDPNTNPDGLVNLGVSENYAMLPDISAFVNDRLGKLPMDSFSYGEGPWGSERLRKAMATFIDRNFKSIKAVDPEKLLFANGVTAICEMLGFTIADPGDGILLSKPIYQAFKIDFVHTAKMKPVDVDFGDTDQFQPAAAERYEQALIQAEREGTKIKALMLCNPHNPLGQCYPKETIIALMKLCSKYQVHLLCDEIYGTSVYDVPDKHAVQFTSALSFDHSEYIDPAYCHIIYGLSKDFAAGGLRLGCIYLRNDELARAMASIGPFHWSGTPNQYIAAKMLEDEGWLEMYQHKARRELAYLNKLTRSLLENADIGYHRGANAGFFLWVDLRPFLPPAAAGESDWSREQELSKRLVMNKLYLTEGQGLTAEEPGFFRLIFSQDERTLRAGMKRLFTAIGKKEAAKACG